MKFVAVSLIMLLAGASAMPPQNLNDNDPQQRIVGDIVAGLLENASQQIRDAGLDPFTIEEFALAYQLPVPVLFSISGVLEDAVVSGISNIVINNISYGLLSGRLQLDISLPELAVALGGASVESVVLGSELGASVRGKLAVLEARIFGEVRVSVGLSGISVRELALEFDLGGINFNGNVNVLGYDLTSFVTDMANNRIPTAIKEHRNEINELIEIVAWQVIDQIL